MRCVVSRNAFANSFRIGPATKCTVRASERVETETHLRTATRSCDLRCPCTADGRSGGRDVVVIFTRDARPRRGPRKRGCSVVPSTPTLSLLVRLSRFHLQSRIGLALVKSRTGSVPPSGNIRARMRSVRGFAFSKRD